MNNLVSKSGALQFSSVQDVVVFEIDCPGKSVNTFTVEFLEDFQENFLKVSAFPVLKGLIITSKKTTCFSAGADLSIFESMLTKEQAIDVVSKLHVLFNLIASVKFPVVAAVNGLCVGGGLEMILACKYRIVTSDPSTKLGLPEVKLGIIPGGGGTQRLPKLIGIAQALDLILTGKVLDAKKAFRLGLVHAVVPKNQLLAHALEICENKQLADTYVTPQPSRLKFESNVLAKTFINHQTRKTILKNTGGHYPAAFKALEAVMYSINGNLDEGLKFEAKAFAECVMSSESRALVHLFRTITAAKKCPVSDEMFEVAKSKWLNPLKSGELSVGILGAGLMGAGIATVLAEKKIRSVLIDKNAKGLEAGFASIREYFLKLLQKRRLSVREQELATSRVSGSLELASLKNSPFVIEAVYEDLEIKRQMLQRLETIINKDFIFASNTSSLPIAQIAATAKNPGNVIGMHFFSPVPKMPLVEIIKTHQTSADVLAASFEIAQEMGKNVIVVNDGPGFFTTRVLGFLIAEALAIFAEGTKIEVIDKAMTDFGWPVGPIALTDEVGIDVAVHVMDTLRVSFSGRIQEKLDVKKLVQDNRLGRKSGRGFYAYKGKNKEPDQSVYDVLNIKISENQKLAEEITERCLMVFIAESIRCLQDGILGNSADGDLGAVFGLGFPPFLGGPFHYIREHGADNISSRLANLAQKYGARFEVNVPQ